MRNEDQAVMTGAGEASGDVIEKPSIAQAPDQAGGDSPTGDTGEGRIIFRRGIVGVDDPHGRPAHETPPGDYPPFNPAFICVLFIDLKPNWTMAINHASYEIQPDPDPEVSKGRRLAKAIAVIHGKIASGRDLAQVPGHLPYAWRKAGHQPNRTHDSTSLRDFRFRSATEIFVFLNNDGLIMGGDDDLFRFTRYGANGAAMDKNFSFFNARQVAGNDLGVLRGRGKLLRIENHARVDVDTTTDMEPQDYSLNIGIGVDCGNGETIPVIIDPDTGNGQGNEP